MNSQSSDVRHEKLLHMSAKVCVAEVVSSRYRGITSVGRVESAGGERPQSWDQRVAGIDVVRAVGGETIKLHSMAMQSTPKPGWVIVLTGGSEDEGYTWTLYGMSRTH